MDANEKMVKELKEIGKQLKRIADALSPNTTHIEPYAGGTSTSFTARCCNCGTPMFSNDKYCPNCGGKVVD